MYVDVLYKMAHYHSSMGCTVQNFLSAQIADKKEFIYSCVGVASYIAIFMHTIYAPQIQYMCMYACTHIAIHIYRIHPNRH